jgi:peptide-methionine (R)-S-oxide reductase
MNYFFLKAARMKTAKIFFPLMFFITTISTASFGQIITKSNKNKGDKNVITIKKLKNQLQPMTKKILTEKEWKSQLTENEYHILREKGTEAPHTGKYNLHFEKGTYHCKGCNTALFDSETKFDAHCGWPSFDKAKKGTITYVKDASLGRVRTEIICTHCEGHLGHVFEDGPTETGLRYCVNSASIKFE